MSKSNCTKKKEKEFEDDNGNIYIYCMFDCIDEGKDERL